MRLSLENCVWYFTKLQVPTILSELIEESSSLLQLNNSPKAKMLGKINFLINIVFLVAAKIKKTISDIRLLNDYYKYSLTSSKCVIVGTSSIEKLSSNRSKKIADIPKAFAPTASAIQSSPM